MVSASALNIRKCIERQAPGVRVLLFVFAYYVAGMVGRASSLEISGFTCFWPPCGLFLAVLLSVARREWRHFVLAGMLTSLLIGVTLGVPLLLNVAFALANASGAVFGAWAIRRFVAARLDLSSMRDMVLGLLVIGALVAPALAAIMGATVATGVFGTWDKLLSNWHDWWIGNVLGVLTLAPVFLTWPRAGGARMNSARLIEAGLLAVAFALGVASAIGSGESLHIEQLYWFIPFLVWAAVRFSLYGAAMACLTLVVTVICTTSMRDSVTSVNPQLLLASGRAFQHFVLLMASTTLVLATTIAGREKAEKATKKSEKKLERYSEHLETLVEERTSELLLARDAAEAANRAKSIFLANMSHEIRTPMNAVLGFAQLLERDPSLSPPARNRVATIMKSGDHLLAIINDILEMSRIEAGRVELRTEAVDLCRLLDDLAVVFRMRAEEKGLAFSLECAPELPRYIVTDQGKLRQIMVNLLGNAVKFTKVGSISLRAISAGSNRIAIEVQDSGIGITPEELKKLFRPFERTRSGEQAAGGTGLGLAISREYARLMGGKITVASVTGEGSRFRFEFNAPVTAVEPSSADKRARRVTAIAPGQGEIRVLVVDDLATNRELLRGMLEPLGFVVNEAPDGSEAIEKTNTLKPRIILMDMVMPGMDGIEATRVLRNGNPSGPLTIIGISASAFEEDKKDFLRAGVDGFIAKPFREQELYDVLAEHAGVVFTLLEGIVISETGPSRGKPTLEKMSREWHEALREALAMKNITRIRKLGEAAQEVDPQLSAWILEQVARYDLKGLTALAIYGINGAAHE